MMQLAERNSEVISWTNQNNAYFYEHVPVKLLMRWAKEAGLDTGCDLDLIDSYIKKAKSILEIGAGYGRVLQQLLLRGYQNKLVAVERSLHFTKTLKIQYSKNAEIINGDIQTIDLINKNGTFDLMLWLWSGVAAFSRSEQLLILSKIAKLLDENGVLVIDTYYSLLNPNNSVAVQDRNYVIESDDGTNNIVYAYIPTVDEVANYAKILGLSHFEALPYATVTQQQRMLYILGKPTL